MSATRRGRRGRQRVRVRRHDVVHVGDFFHHGPNADYASEALRSIDQVLAREALAGVRVTGDTPVQQLLARIRTVAIGAELIGPAALIAYRDPAIGGDLFTAWKTARDHPTLPTPLGVAGHLAPTFRGTVADLATVAVGIAA